MDELKKYTLEIDEFVKTIDDKEIADSYEQWKNERKKILDLVSLSERELIEAKIKVEIVKMFRKRKGDFFYYEDLLSSELLRKYFKIIVCTGDRNIGKSTSAKRIAEANKWIWLRNQRNELEAQVKSHIDSGWFESNGWELEGGLTSSSIDVVSTESEKIIGYYRDVNTIGKFKSIDFPETELIIWEEFNSPVKISNKFEKFATFVSTVQRHRPNMLAILQANYVDNTDEMLTKLGIPITKLSKDKFVFFNWITGAINIFIPKSIYKSIGEAKDNLGYRLSLNDHDVWKSQYGAQFSNEELLNIIDSNNFTWTEARYNIYFYSNIDRNTIKLTVYNVIDEDGIRHNFISNTRGANDKPTLVVDYISNARYPNSVLVNLNSLEVLVSAWHASKLCTDNIEVFSLLVKLLAEAKKQNENSSEKFISELEQIM